MFNYFDALYVPQIMMHRQKLRKIIDFCLGVLQVMHVNEQKLDVKH